MASGSWWLSYSAPLLIQFLGTGIAIPVGTSIYWSLAVEEHFYLFFPVPFRAAFQKLSRKAIVRVVLAVCGAVLVWRCILVLGFNASLDRTYTSTDTRIDATLFDATLAFVHPLPWRRTWMRWVRQPIAQLSVGLMLIAFSFVVRSDLFRETARYTIQSVGLFFVFSGLLTRPEAVYARWLDWPLLRRVGVLSYTLYLVHVASIRFNADRLPSVPWPVTGALAFCFLWRTHS